MPNEDTRQELVDLGDLIMTCRDRAHVLRQDSLAYHLAMAVVATDIASGEASALREPTMAPTPLSRGIKIGTPFPPPDRRQDLVDLRTMIEGCRDRALDVREGILAYILDVALVTVTRTLSGRD